MQHMVVAFKAIPDIVCCKLNFILFIYWAFRCRLIKCIPFDDVKEYFGFVQGLST